MSNDPLGLFSNDTADNDPLGLFSESEKAGVGTAIKSSFANVGNMADTAASTLAGSMAALFGDDKAAIDIDDQLRERLKSREEWANSEKKELTFGGKLAGMATTLPMQIVGAGLSPADTAMKFKDAGESDANTLKAAGVDALGNIAGMLLPGFKQGGMLVRGATGGAANAAQDYVTKEVISSMAETDKAKEQFKATGEDALLAGILGGATAAAVGKQRSKPLTGEAAKLSKLDDIATQRAAQKADPAIAENVARLHDQTILERLKELDKQISQEKFTQEPVTRTGSETLYVDPQGQVFRGDPGEEMARMGLEKQTEAMDTALDSNTLRPPGDPLGLLQMDQLRSANEGPQGEMLQIMQNQLKQELASQKAMKIPKSQRGAVNPEVFSEGFQKVKELGDYTLKMFGRPWGPEVAIIDKDGNEVGGLTTSSKWFGDDKSLSADFVKVQEAHRGKGLAEAAYKFLAEEGNDIRRSSTLLDDGKKMWNRFEETGVSKNGYIPRKQRGAIDLGAKKQEIIAKAIGKNKDGNFIPDDPDVASSLELARTEKDGRALTYTESGASLAAMKRGSTAVKVAGELVQNAFKRADLAIRKNVFPTENALKALPVEELKTLGEVLKKEMFQGEKFNGQDLVDSGFSVKQLTAYNQIRKMFDDSLRIQNEAREAKGQKPVTPMEAYLSSRWQGDFRRPVYNKDGKLVWYLAADTKMGLDQQTKTLLKEFPELKFDPNKDHTVRFWNRKTDLESAYTTMLDILGRDDPAVEKIKAYMEDTTVGKGATYLNQEKHFKAKGNVRGFVGDRPGTANSPKEVLAMFQQQVQYAKNAYRWSELQKAGQGLKDIINDPALVANQPNNIKYIREYFKHAIGYGESRAMRAIEDSIRDVGLSPAPFDRAVGGLKSYFILQKLAANTGYLAANAIQLSMIAPHLADLAAKGYRSNPLTAIAAGLLGGTAMGSGHIVNSLGGKAPDVPGMEFYNRAFKYAEDNGITARSIYDESPIENSFSAVGKTANALGKTMTVPETYVRSAAFMTFAQYLKDSGKFKTETEIFKEAERRTNVAMVDYAQTERPMMFAKLGTAGNFLNTLQTFGINYYNQQSYFFREAAKGNVAPLMTSLAIQYMIAGAMGIPGFEDAYKMLMGLKDMLPAKQWKMIQDHPFLSDPKLWMLENFGQSSVYGALSDISGIGLTSRVAAPSAGQMMQSPAGPITDIAKQVGNVASAVADPTNSSKWAQAGMSVTPTGLQGLLETAPFMEGTTYDKRPDGLRVYGRNTDMADHRGEYTRTPKQDLVRKFGLRSQDEVVQRDVAYSTNRVTQAVKEKSRTLPDAFYDAVKRGDMKKAAELQKLHVELTGSGISNEQLEAQIKENYLTSAERSRSATSAVQSLLHMRRTEKILQELKEKK